MTERRININKAAPDARAHVDELQHTPENVPVYDYTHRWDQYKPERNGLGAYLINAAFEKTFSSWSSGERGPYGLLEVDLDIDRGYLKSDPVVLTEIPFSKPLGARGEGPYQSISEPLSVLEKSMYSTVRYDIRQEIDRRKELPSGDQDRKELDRLERLTLGFDDGIQIVYDEPVYRFLSRGVGTAIGSIRAAVNTVDYKYWEEHGQHISGVDLGSTLRNSTRLLQRFASGNINTNLTAMRMLEDLNTRRFSEDIILQGNPEGLDISKEQWRLYLDTAREEGMRYRLRQTESVTTGCPALASTDIVKSETTSDEYIEAVPNVIQGVTSWAASIFETL